MRVTLWLVHGRLPLVPRSRVAGHVNDRDGPVDRVDNSLCHPCKRFPQLKHFTEVEVTDSNILSTEYVTDYAP